LREIKLFKFNEIWIRNLDRIPVQCADKLAENGERQGDRETEKQKIELDKEKPKMLNYFEINCICSSLGEPKFWTFLQDRNRGE
jgi:hypothetical protein